MTLAGRPSLHSPAALIPGDRAGAGDFPGSVEDLFPAPYLEPPIEVFITLRVNRIPEEASGNRIASASNSSGSSEIWVCNSHGTKPIKLTDMMAAGTGSPNWSLDGKWLLYCGGIYSDDSGAGRPQIHSNSSSSSPPSQREAHAL